MGELRSAHQNVLPEGDKTKYKVLQKSVSFANCQFFHQFNFIISCIISLIICFVALIEIQNNSANLHSLELLGNRNIGLVDTLTPQQYLFFS